MVRTASCWAVASLYQALTTASLRRGLRWPTGLLRLSGRCQVPLWSVPVSRRGLHIFGLLPEESGQRRGRVEIYSRATDSRRYLPHGRKPLRSGPAVRVAAALRREGRIPSGSRVVKEVVGHGAWPEYRSVTRDAGGTNRMMLPLWWWPWGGGW